MQSPLNLNAYVTNYGELD